MEEGLRRIQKLEESYEMLSSGSDKATALMTSQWHKIKLVNILEQMGEGLMKFNPS